MDWRFLSVAETIVMKAIWDSKKKRTSTYELLIILKEQYGKQYARTTVVSFLQKLSYKGFIRYQREGKNSYIEVLRKEEGYVAEVIKNQIDFWFEGKVANAISALIINNMISKNDVNQIMGMLHEEEKNE